MIYYPGFEVEDSYWLKFALLYFDELRPIIPPMAASRNQYLSKNAIRVMDSTNLIRPYTPAYGEECRASIVACEHFDEYLRNPERYSYTFTKVHNINLLNRWQNSNNQICRLYNGKFSQTFYDYCIENRIATPFSNGIKISKDLAFAYMSFLADIIARNQQCETFTDVSKYHDLLVANDMQFSDNKILNYKIAKTQIEMHIPTQIKDIPLKKIIELRNSGNFDIYRRAFAEEIKKFLIARESNPDLSFSNQQLDIQKNIFELLGLTCGAVSSVYLTYSSITALVNDAATLPLAVASAFSDARTLAELKQFSKVSQELKTKFFAKRYLGQISKCTK